MTVKSKTAMAARPRPNSAPQQQDMLAASNAATAALQAAHRKHLRTKQGSGIKEPKPSAVKI